MGRETDWHVDIFSILLLLFLLFGQAALALQENWQDVIKDLSARLMQAGPPEQQNQTARVVLEFMKVHNEHTRTRTHGHGHGHGTFCLHDSRSWSLYVIYLFFSNRSVSFSMAHGPSPLLLWGLGRCYRRKQLVIEWLSWRRRARHSCGSYAALPRSFCLLCSRSPWGRSAQRSWFRCSEDRRRYRIEVTSKKNPKKTTRWEKKKKIRKEKERSSKKAGRKSEAEF